MAVYFLSIAFNHKEVLLRSSAFQYVERLFGGIFFPFEYKLRARFIRSDGFPERLIRKFPDSFRGSGTFVTSIGQKLRERFFISELNRKDFYLDLMTSLGNFDSILDDADLVHEDKFSSPGSPAWEAGRFHQAIWLGKAYWISRSEAHADKFKTIVDRWITGNPARSDINRTSPEESSIRAMNLIVGLLYFSGSARIDEGFLLRLLSLLYEHGVFIRSTIGRRSDPGRMTILCLTGLLYLGILFYDTRDGKRWADFARRELDFEIRDKVSKDGSLSDNWISRHCLATESLTCAYVLHKLNGFPVSDSFSNRLERMFHFLSSATMRDGTLPQIGEATDERIFRMSSKILPKDHRDLLAAGAAIFGSAEARAAAGDFSELALLFLGGEGFEKYSAIAEGTAIPSAIYPKSGYAFMRSEKDFASFNFGQIRSFKDETSHNHLLSFTIAGKNPFVVDRWYCSSPGSTIPARPYSTIAHNTLLIDGIEQGDLTGPDGRSSVRPELLGWLTSEEQDSIEAQYHLRARNAGILTHKRNITFNKHQRTFRVEDDILGEGEHVIDMAFHFASGLQVLDLGRNFLAIEGEEFALMKFQHPFTLEEWEVSNGSDGRHPAKSARVVLEIRLPVRIETFIFITSNEDDMNYLLNRIRPGGAE